MKIEDKLLKLRKEKGLSQEEVADRLNVSRQTISKWETGQSSPDFDKIIPLCELYEISSDELLTGKKKEEIVKEEKEHENMKAKGIGLSLGIYVLSIILFVFLISLAGVIVALGIFFLGVILATALFIYTCVMYKGKNDMKFLKKLIKKIDSTVILVVLTFINLIFTWLRNTWSWYNDTDIYHDALLPIVKLLNNDYITGLLVVINIFIFILGIRFIINAFKSKKEVLLKVSFASLSILTSYFAVEIFTNLVLDYFLNI
ncbi:MAG: helix-turn-helix domain-containing protein [Firmicutes bacterium]|nr:helix-turn-helix domain-containing protein [Bacillota bacterium]